MAKVTIVLEDVVTDGVSQVKVSFDKELLAKAMVVASQAGSYEEALEATKTFSNAERAAVFAIHAAKREIQGK